MSNNTVMKLAKNYLLPVCIGLLFGIFYLQFQTINALKEQTNTVSEQSGNINQSRVLAAQTQTSYADAIAMAQPSIVKIYTTKIVSQKLHPLYNDPLFQRFFRDKLPPQNKVSRGLGSGIIVSINGFILTNNHVVREADDIQVMLTDGRIRKAVITGTDPETDLAVLKIESESLSAIKFADPEKVRVGDIVFAIGNPYGIGQTVTQGIVSATGRYGLQLNTYENYIQTDAAINQGNSGGALINTEGELIGINNALLTTQRGGSNGIGFAIPVDTADYVFNSIIKQGKVIRGWLGISVEDITPALAETFNLKTAGLAVTQIVPTGPAARAGLQAGDIITHLNDQAIDSGNIGMHTVAEFTPNETVKLRIVRDGSEQNLTVTVGKRPTQYSNKKQ